MNRQLLEPILEGGIRNTNFFNGRLLAAEDLQAEQAAQRQANQQLGQAIGGGVIEGLEVQIVDDGSSGSTPTVAIGAGLALNAQGETLALPAGYNVTLVQPSQALVAPEAGLFSDCATERLMTIPTGVGFYVLLAAPASGLEENAPMSGLGADGRITGCGSRYVVEGITFWLLKLDLAIIPGISDTTRNALNALMGQTDTISVSLLRNMLAYLCFGTEELAGLACDPFASIGSQPLQTHYGALDALQDAGRLSGCDVPLALLYWSSRGISFVDMWSVRRRPIAPAAAASSNAYLGERRVREAEAIVMQFADHLETLRTTISDPRSIVAAQFVRYLPPVGILPLASATFLQRFDYATFFSQQVYHTPVYLEGSRMEALIRSALPYAPIDLWEPIGRKGKAMVWLYRAHENGDPRSFLGGTLPLPYLIFTGGHVPFQGAALLDIAHLDFSNYTPATA